MPVMSDSPPALTVSGPERYFDRFTPPPVTTEERLLRIQVLGERIAAYVQFMGAVGDLKGSSLEAKENAVGAFYERLSTAERQLGRIHNDLQLG